MIVVVDGCGTNIASVMYALKRLGHQAILTTDHQKIKNASHVLLPGVGTAGHALAQLRKYELIHVIKELTQPVLGICLGMQLLYDFSAEGNVDCLGIISGKVRKIPGNEKLAVPHMGWNQLNITASSPLLNNVKNNSYCYFVHSYFAPVNEYTCAGIHYGIDFSAAVSKNNFYAVQFHPEKSGQTGLQILANFLELS